MATLVSEILEMGIHARPKVHQDRIDKMINANLEWEDQVSKDKINPPHYKNNPIQTFDAITSQFSDAEKIEPIKFNICKYIMRMGKKVETLEGARDDLRVGSLVL